MDVTNNGGNFNDPTHASVTPNAGAYGVLQAQAENAYSSALGQINDKRTSFLQNQGLIGRYDTQTGNFIGADVDPNNQGGAYQQMSNANAGQGAADDAAIGAMGFGGGLQAQQHEAADRSYSQLATNWALNAGQGLGDLSQQGVDARATESTDLYNNLVTNIQQAITNGTFDPADYTNVDVGNYGSLNSDQLSTIAQGLGWNPAGSGSGGGSGGSTGHGSLGGGGAAGGGGSHPVYQRWQAAHPNNKMTLKQWIAAGRPH